MTFDVTTGPHSSLITLTDRAAAERIAAALEGERAHLFQAEGITFGVKETNRDAGLKKDEESETETIGKKSKK